MSQKTVDALLVGIGLLYFAAAIVWITVALHMAYTKMDRILEHLKNCTAIMVRAPLRHGGPWGRLMLIGGISGIVTFPNFYLKRGELCPEDLEKFPANLKRKLAVLQWTLLGLLLGLLFVMRCLAAIANFDLA
jgi:hypothetical protein